MHDGEIVEVGITVGYSYVSSSSVPSSVVYRGELVLLTEVDSGAFASRDTDDLIAQVVYNARAGISRSATISKRINEVTTQLDHFDFAVILNL